MADNSAEDAVGDDPKEIKTSVKSYPHVAPRVDADSYQAELPELELSNKAKSREGMLISDV